MTSRPTATLIKSEDVPALVAGRCLLISFVRSTSTPLAEPTKNDRAGAISKDALLDAIKLRRDVGARLTRPTAGRTIAESGKELTKRGWDENRAQREELREDRLLTLAACASPHRPRHLPCHIQSGLCGEIRHRHVVSPLLQARAR